MKPHYTCKLISVRHNRATIQLLQPHANAPNDWRDRETLTSLIVSIDFDSGLMETANSYYHFVNVVRTA